MGETQLEGATWIVASSVSPKGTHVYVEISTEQTTGRLHLNAEQAQELGDELLEAATWCRRKDAA